MKRITLFPKLLIGFLAVSVPPLVWLSFDAAARIAEVRENAVAQATRTLDAKAGKALEMQAQEVAGEFERFLGERLGDLLLLADLHKAPEHFRAFHEAKRGEVWARAASPGGGMGSARVSVPLYSELAWIGADGRELLRMTDGQAAKKEELRDVSDPRNTTFGVEDYFLAARVLEPGQYHVGRVTGYHVSKAEQLGGAKSIEDALDGAEYRGHVRLAMPVYRGGRLEGVVALALDHRHLMEFTQHVLPLSTEKVVFPSYQSGNYAFLFDDEGWIITHPKYWDIRGLDRAGRWVPAYSTRSTKEEIDAGRIPFRLDEAGFVDPNYPLAAAEVRAGRSGVTRTSNVAGVEKVMAYAPVRLPLVVAGRNGLFGGVTIGSQTEGFHAEAAKTGEEIGRAAAQTVQTSIYTLIILLAAVSVAAFFLSRAIANPIHRLAGMVRKISAGDLSVRVEGGPDDEVGDLAADINYMAALLQEKERKLLASLSELGVSRDDAHAYAERLEEQLKLFGQVQAMSEVLGTTFEREPVFALLLSSCVNELGFDRAAIYVLAPDKGLLERIAHAGYGQAPPEPRIISGGHSMPARAVAERRAARGALDGGGFFACVPMVIRDTVIGAFYADTSRSGRAVTDQATGALAIVGGQTARAIERARLFEAVSREREFVEAVIASVATGLVTLDHEGRVTSLNPYAREMLGQGEELIGFTLAKAALPEPLLDWVEAMGAGAEPEPREFDLAQNGSPATTIWVPSRFSGVDGPGLILQFRDVTGERAMHREIERVDRLASLGRLAAGVAHEVRNPLTGVSLLLDDLHDRLKSEADRELVARALQEIERLEGLVQSMLDYARVGKVTKREVSLGGVVEGSLFLVKRSALSQGVRFSSEIAPDLPKIVADPDKLKQALLNFYLNALQAMEPGGELSVTARRSEGGAEIIIADTGAGIPESELDRIYEPFHTLRSGGSGMGLSIAHTIISDHGGRIEVVSRVGAGTTFTIHLPCAE